MDRKQVIELFKLLKSVYPSFEVSTPKVDSWTRLMRKMDFVRVMEKAEQHSLENKFPPTIAEIAAYAPEKNEHLEKMRQWEIEAAQVPESTKLQFREQMIKLIQEKSK
ncbi:replicative helicase loader/inhibitor [Paucisalibacillus globulus]|uniref:replicative helicase loader/inhibitor n=1 Tax=Paucisalibacillus globulus TaxID=351095 RepID=UPI00040291F1|nr:replicative helicase loader/inhibitor [Paucisalibacillus globulus]